MTRTGERALLLAALLAAAAASAADDVEFYQTVDKAEVGDAETFQLSVVTVNAPAGATLQLPELRDFHLRSRTPVNQTSVQMINGRTSVQRIRKQVLVLQPNRPGTFTIPPSVLKIGAQTQTTDAIEITVRKGRLSEPPRDPRDLFGRPFPGFPDDPRRGPDVDVPTSESDLFIRTTVDQSEAYVGEQITMSVYLFSRLDISEVASINVPRLEGFWAEDLDSPTQLQLEQRILDGVPYRAYLLKRKTLFPTRAGKLEIPPVKSEIVTGYLFAGHRVRRQGNKVVITARPLPSGAPKGFDAANVGEWQLSRQVTPERVALGEPFTVKVVVEGKGNVKNASPPKLEAPPSLRVYEPTAHDEVQPRPGRFGGRRTLEYLVMPSQTGSFTLPQLSFAYFDPSQGKYATASVPAVTVRVDPAGAVAQGAGATGQADGDAAKNVLTKDGLHPLRHAPNFGSSAEPPWVRPWFVPAIVSPIGLWAAVGLVGLVRSRRGKEDVRATRRLKTREARRRLSEARKLAEGGAPEGFYVEVQSALEGFLEAHLELNARGLTRDALDSALAARGVLPEPRSRVLAVLEACEVGRFAPRAGAAEDRAARARVLEDAAAAMGALGSR